MFFIANENPNNICYIQFSYLFRQAPLICNRSWVFVFHDIEGYFSNLIQFCLMFSYGYI